MSDNTKEKEELVEYLLSDEYFPLLDRAILSRYGTSRRNKEKHEKAIGLMTAYIIK